MAHRAAWFFVVLACGCSGRQGTYVVASGGAPPEAGPEGGSGGAKDAGTDATDGGDAAMAPACIDACATLLSVGCANDDMNDCLYACADTRGTYAACASQYDAFNACAAKEPLSHYYCDIDGFAALHPGYCATEKNAFVSCRHTH